MCKERRVVTLLKELSGGDLRAKLSVKGSEVQDVVTVATVARHCCIDTCTPTLFTTSVCR